MNKVACPLFSLAKLNPFAIEGNLPAYANLNRTDMSDKYLEDRAQYLYYLLDKTNRYDVDPTLSMTHYEDAALGVDYTLKQSFSRSRVLFGGEGKSTLNGGEYNDRLYGMGGDDVLTGNGGDDYMEGGTGNDVLVGGVGSDGLVGGAGNDVLIGTNGYGGDDGVWDTLNGGGDFDTYIAGNRDVIYDSDQRGRVVFKNIDLSGRKTKSKNGEWYEDNDFFYTETGGSLVVSAKKGGNSVTINDWNTMTKKGLGVELTKNKDIDVSITKSASAMEGNSGKRSLYFTVTLSRALEDGESLRVSVTNTEGGIYTFTSGQRSHTFTHSWIGDTVDEGDIDHVATLTPTASYSGPYTGVKVKVLNSGTAIVYDDDEDNRHDPLALDMDMDGFISTTDLATSGTYFDITGDGLRERVGWISPADALLVYDKNDNGQIDGIDEIFGSLTESGFEELKRTIDSNYDNKIDRRDELFAQLQLWHDTNQDAMVQEGELTSLSDEGVTAIDLNYVSTRIEINGNLLTEASKYSTDGGTKELVADIQLATDVADTKVNLSDIPGFTIDETTRTLPQLKGSGLVYDAFILYNTNNEFKALSEVLASDSVKAFNDFESYLEQWSGYTKYVDQLKEKYSLADDFTMQASDKHAWIIDRFSAKDDSTTTIQNYYNTNLNNGKIPAAAIITDASVTTKYTALLEKTQSSFIILTHLKDLFSDTHYDIVTDRFIIDDNSAFNTKIDEYFNNPAYTLDEKLLLANNFDKEAV